MIIYKGRRVLVTGHTGFKGAWLSLWLTELGADVIGYALKPPTEPSLFEVCDVGKRMTSIEADIRNSEILNSVFKKYQPEIVFHMAAQPLVRRSYREPKYTYETNIMGTVNLLEASRGTPSVRAIVNVTSDKCYENREQEAGYKECDPMGGYDPYSSSKGCSELITGAYIRSYFNPSDYKTHKIAAASARSGNVLGGGDWSEDRLIPDCVKAFLQKRPAVIRFPEAIRPWQHVLDPVYGYLLLAKRLYEDGPEFSGSWNFGPDETGARPVRWIVEEVSRLWGKGGAWTFAEGQNPHEAHYLKLDCGKARSCLKWQPVITLKSSILKTIEWYKRYYGKMPMLDFTLDQIKGYQREVGKDRDELQILREKN